MSVTIGAEAVITPPESLDFGRIVNFRPGNGAAADFNPPRVSWSYTPDPLDTFADTDIRRFKLQIANNSGFTSPTVEVMTRWNFYNFLPVLAAGTWYWRVGYYAENGTTFDQWSATRTFTISGSEPEWDRSMLADETYLSGKAAHPHILFTSATRSAMHTYMTGSQATAWSIFTGSADFLVAKSYWPSTLPDFGTQDEFSWLALMASTAFVYGLTQDATYAGLGAQLKLAADRYISLGLGNDDEVSDARASAYIETLGLGYDWCYDVLTGPQKTAILAALASRMDGLMAAGYWEDHTGASNILHVYSVGKASNSHGFINFVNPLVGALAAYGEDASCRAYFDLWLNYAIGVTCPFGTEGTINQGRGYLVADFLTTAYNLRQHMLAAVTFPEAQIEQNPYWSTLARWLDAFLPVGHTQIHEPWGDGDPASFTYWNGMRDLALFTGDGAALRHYTNQLALPPSSGDRGTETFYSALAPHLFTAPSAANSTPGAVLYPDFGVVGSTIAPNTGAGFTDGLGFVFQARPRGCEGGHSHYSDGSFQLWAYGAPLTDAAAGYSSGYAKVPLSHYSLLINGYGTAQPFESQIVPRYCEFIAEKHGATYDYFCADLTHAYPRTSFTPSGSPDLPGGFRTLYEGAPLSGLTKVRRHFLFVRSKYWVIFDELEYTSAATFSFLYHVHPNTVTLDGTNKRFSYTVQNAASADVTVHVAQIGTGAGLTITDRTGTDVAKNPHTGEDYYNSYGDTDTNRRAHCLWVENATPATSFNFLTAIVPVAPGGSAPTITRLDDKTVSVDFDGSTDVISFDPETVQPYTLLVSLATPGETGTSGSIVATTANFGTLTIG